MTRLRRSMPHAPRMEESAPPTGVLVLRVWSEPSETDPADLRSRLRATLDVTSDTSEEWAVAGRDDVVGAIESWIDRFVARVSRDGTATPE
jgi:hypothetical protein